MEVDDERKIEWEEMIMTNRNNNDSNNRIAGLEHAVKLLIEAALQPDGLTIEQKLELRKVDLSGFSETGKKIAARPWSAQRGGSSPAGKEE